MMMLEVLVMVLYGWKFSQTVGQANENVVFEVTKGIALHLQSRCILLLYSDQQKQADRGRIQNLVRRFILDEDTRVSCIGLTFTEFLNIKARENSTYRIFYNPTVLIVHSDKDTQENLNKVSNMILAYTVNWLVFLNSSLEHYYSFFSGFNARLDVKLAVADYSQTNQVTVREVYQVHSSFNLTIDDIGYWTPHSQLVITAGSINLRRRNLQGLVFRIAATQNPPLHWIEKYNSTTSQLEGYFPEVWRQLELVLNFKSVSVRSADNFTGIQNKDKTWNGLVGMLVRKEIDMAVSEFIIDKQRTKVIHLSLPLWDSYFQLFFKKRGDKFNWYSVLQPFEKNVWITILCWLIAGATGLFLCHYYTHKLGVESETTLEEYTWINSYFFMLKTLCNQGNAVVPASIPGRVIIIMSYMATAVLVPCYSASLICYLTHSTPSAPFDSLQGLLNDGHYKLQTNAKTTDYTYFSEAKDKLRQDIYTQLLSRIPEDQLPVGTEEGLRRLCDDPYMVHFGGMHVGLNFAREIHNERSDCEIMTLSQGISLYYSSIAFQRNSPYRDIFNFYLLIMTTGGIIDRAEMKTMPLDEEITASPWTEVSLYDAGVIFILLIGGMLLSVIILMLEYLHCICTKNKENTAIHQINHSHRVHKLHFSPVSRLQYTH